MSRFAWALGIATVLGCSAALGACSLFGSTTKPTSHSTNTAPRPTVRRIAQLDFGRDSRYAPCVEPACPQPTVKTLATQVAQGTEPTPAATLPTATAASAAVGTALVRAPVAVAQAASATPPAAHTLVLHFANRSAVLTAAHKALLRNSLSELQHTDRIVIAGRTDDLGSEALNQSLALARALAIRDHLLDLAPDLPARIAIDAKGRCCYAAGNDTASGRAQNRRVEISFTPHVETAP
jgi:outer membrane protein OmpA-like peptidoglycan-associated protein